MNYRVMPKMNSDTKVRVIFETEGRTTEYRGLRASFSGGGYDNSLNSIEVHNPVLFRTEKEEPVPPTRANFIPNPVPEQCPHEKALIGAAKAQERATLRAARLIEQAQEQAEALINDADHTLNMAIQAYQHTGKSALDTDRVLEDAGIYSNERRTENVATLNTEDLYLLDATELLTVG